MDHIIKDSFIMEWLKGKIALWIHKVYAIEVHSNKIFVMAKAYYMANNNFLKELFFMEKKDMVN